MMSQHDNSLPSVDAPVSGVRFSVHYEFAAESESAARQVALGIALEQTVELPEVLTPRGDIRDGIVGRCGDPQSLSGERWRVAISYPVEAISGSFPGLISTVFANTSMMAAIRVAAIEIDSDVASLFPGPRFGTPGIRQRLAAQDRPLVGTALKPMGYPPAELARIAGAFARGGIDVIKDDHNLMDQSFAPFRERVAHCAEAVNEANAQTGGHSMYVPHVSGPIESLLERAHVAHELGAGGLEIMPGVMGYDSIRLLASEQGPGLPLFSHPGMLGTYTIHPGQGLSHRVIFGSFARLAGADVSIFTGYGGRFPTTEDDCRGILEAAREPLGSFPSILPMPGGGMTTERIPEMVRFYGNDVILLISGDLFRGEGGLEATARRFRDAVG